MKKLICSVVLAITITPGLFAQSISLNNRQYISIDNQWYQQDNGKQFRVNNSVITVKFKQNALSQDIASIIESKGAQKIRTNILGFMDLQIPENVDPILIVQEFLKSDVVEIAEPNTFGEYFGDPNDSLYSSQWHHKYAQDHDIDSPEAWGIETGSSSVIIGILDSGTDILHEDLEGNIWVNPGEDMDGDGVVWDTSDIDTVDNDSNGYTDDIVGWDFHNNNNDVVGPFWHGTAVAGIAGAVTNNNTGVAGVAGGWGTSSPGARLMILGVGDNAPNGSILDDAILYAAANGADIIQMSLTVGQSAAIDAALASAHQQADGVFIVCASGNSNSTVGYPARAKYVYAVGATNTSDQRASFSNNGDSLDVVAPGEDIWSSRKNNSYGTGDGTSFASPQVAGIAALILSAVPSLTNSNIEEIIARSAEKVGGYSYSQNKVYGTWNNEMGYGRVNAFQAVLSVFGDPQTGTIPTATTWTEDVVLYGDVNLSGLNTVNSGVKMEIVPGTTLKFEDGAILTIKGQLIAEGTSSNNITFQSVNASPPPGSWQGISVSLAFINTEGPSLVKYSTVKDAKWGIHVRYANSMTIDNNIILNSERGIYLWKSDGLLIKNNTITSPTTHGIYAYLSDPIIYNNTITNASHPTSNIGYGIYLSQSSAVVGENTITGSKVDGIRGYGTGVAKIYYDSVNNPLGGGNTITDNLTNGMRIIRGAYPILGWTASTTPGNNTIADNGGKAIYNQNPSFIFANCNYWGGTPLPADFYGLVYYDPWYGYPWYPPDAVCDQYAALPGNSLSEWLYAMLDVIPSYLYAQSDVVGTLNRDATDEFVSGNYSKALGMFKSVVKDFPNSDGVQYALTLAYESHKGLGKKTEFTSYLIGLSNQQANPKVQRFAKLLLMHDLEGNGEFNEALSLGDEILSNDPTDEDVKDVLFRQGMLLAEGTGDKNEAKSKFYEIIRRYPDSDEALFAAEELKYLGEEVGFSKKTFGSGSKNFSLPKEYSLSDNFPNPFNPVTRIEFALPEAGLTRLIIYDLRGREVAKLIDSKMGAGFHNVTWDASKMASGIYIYRLTSGNYVNTKKMVLLK